MWLPSSMKASRYMMAYILKSTPMIIFATADSLRSASMSDMVGHGSKWGCFLYCNMPSQHHMGNGDYYPVMHQPHNYDIVECSHSVIHNEDLSQYQADLAQKYKQNLEFSLASCTQTKYHTWCLAVGLCRQSLFNGLPCQPIPVPNVLTMDIM